MFDRFGNKFGINQRVNDDFNPINLQFSPKISSNDSGIFVIAWNDDRLDITHGEVFAQQFDNFGKKIGQKMNLKKPDRMKRSLTARIFRAGFIFIRSSR